MRTSPATERLRERLLVLRAQTGDEEAFITLYERFAGRTLAYLRGLVGDTAAEDVHQEVWITVFRKIDTLGNPGGFRTWLYRTTRHRAIDHMRRTERHHELLRGAAEEAEGARVPAGTLEDDAPAEPDLTAAMDELPAPQREVLTLRYRQQLPYEEIALVVGCPVGTVRSRIHHAKKNLRRRISGARDDHHAGEGRSPEGDPA